MSIDIICHANNIDQFIFSTISIIFFKIPISSSYPSLNNSEIISFKFLSDTLCSILIYTLTICNIPTITHFIFYDRGFLLFAKNLCNRIASSSLFDAFAPNKISAHISSICVIVGLLRSLNVILGISDNICLI